MSLLSQFSPFSDASGSAGGAITIRLPFTEDVLKGQPVSLETAGGVLRAKRLTPESLVLPPDSELPPQLVATSYIPGQLTTDTNHIMVFSMENGVGVIYYTQAGGVIRCAVFNSDGTKRDDQLVSVPGMTSSTMRHLFTDGYRIYFLGFATGWGSESFNTFLPNNGASFPAPPHNGGPPRTFYSSKNFTILGNSPSSFVRVGRGIADDPTIITILLETRLSYVSVLDYDNDLFIGQAQSGTGAIVFNASGEILATGSVAQGLVIPTGISGEFKVLASTSPFTLYSSSGNTNELTYQVVGNQILSGAVPNAARFNIWSSYLPQAIGNLFFFAPSIITVEGANSSSTVRKNLRQSLPFTAQSLNSLPEIQEPGLPYGYFVGVPMDATSSLSFSRLNVIHTACNTSGDIWLAVSNLSIGGLYMHKVKRTAPNLRQVLVPVLGIAQETTLAGNIGPIVQSGSVDFNVANVEIDNGTHFLARKAFVNEGVLNIL